MATTSKEQSGGKTGSNIPNNPILAHRANLLAEQVGPFRKRARRANQEAKTLFTEADLRVAAKLAGKTNKEWRPKTLKVRGKASKVNDIKAEARKQMDRSFRDNLSKYEKLQSLQKDFSRDYHELSKAVSAAASSDQVHIDWGDLTATTDPDVQEFGPPFPIFDAQNNGSDFAPDDIDDRSHVLPGSGGLVTKVHFVLDDGTSGWLMDEYFGINNTATFTSWVACGVSFTVPKAGRLRIGALLKNLFNHITGSLTNTFGFSHGNLDVELRLFTDIVRLGNVIHIPTVILSDGLISHGSDLNLTMPDLDTSVPYTLDNETDEHFAAGEIMWIVVGSECYIKANLDDMTAHVSSDILWELQKITVGVID